LTLAIKGKKADERWTDYIMSKTFGLNWRDYESRRMEEFILITKIQGDLIKK
jgi:hypothetical protein